MSNEPYVPTLPEIWEFLVAFKETTEAGFTRLEQSFRSEIALVGSRLDRIEGRLARMEFINVDRRLDDHEHRITQLEQRPT